MNVADKTSFDSFLERNRTFLDRAFVYARVEFAQFLVELAFDVAKGKKPHTTSMEYPRGNSDPNGAAEGHGAVGSV